ncbi:MAG: hypothetical protein Q3999_08240 [Buchananella hordeovulneris]|nr:hypothetical protein [Buchananella hordeovulneris]
MTARVELPQRPAGAEFPPLHQVARWSRRAQRSRAPFPLRQRLSDLYILLFGAAVLAGMGYQILTGASAGVRAGAGLGSAVGPGLSLRVDFLPLPLAAAGSLALLAACLGAIGRLGPIFLRPAEALWWLQLPGARQRFLHRRLLVIAGVGTACFGVFGAALAALLTASAASHVLLAAGAGALPGAAGGWLVFAAVASAQVGSNAREGAPAGAGRDTIHSAGRGTEWGAERCATRPRTARTALLLLAALNALLALSPNWVTALRAGGTGTPGPEWAATLPLALVLAQAALLAALALSWWRGQVVAGLEEVPDVSLQESSRRALGLLASGVSLDGQALGRLLSPPERMPRVSSRLTLARLGRSLPTPLRVALAVLQGDALVFARQPWRLLQLGGGIALAAAVGLVRSPFAAAALLLVSGTLTALAAGAGARAVAFRSGAEQHWPAPALLVGAARLQLPFLLGLPWALAVLTGEVGRSCVIR